MNWKIEFYKTQNGKSPVKEWILDLDIKTKAKILKNIVMLKEFNINLKAPYVKPLEDKLYELRTKDSKGIYRIIYFAYTDKTFFLLNGFIKKTRTTPRKEIELAKLRMKEIINNG